MRGEGNEEMLSAGPKTDKEPKKVAAVHPVVKSLAGAANCCMQASQSSKSKRRSASA